MSRSTAAAARRLPPLDPAAAAALARRDLGALPVRTRQLLYVLLARRCRPDAGAEEQLSAFARDAGGWPIDLNDDDDFYDVVAGGESVTVPFYCHGPDGAEQPLPAPFLFIRESVAFDESPRWQKSAMHKGCSCQPQRNKLVRGVELAARRLLLEGQRPLGVRLAAAAPRSR